MEINDTLLSEFALRRLPVIPDPGARSVIVPHRAVDWESVMFGFDDEAPLLVCGNCAAILVTGVDTDRIVPAAEAPPDEPALPLPRGPYWIRKMLLVPPSFVVAVGGDGLAVQCPACWNYNEITRHP